MPQYDRGEVVSATDPYSGSKPRTAVVLTDDRRPQRDDGKYRYTVVYLSGAVEEYGNHDWTVVLDRHGATESGEPPLMKDSVVEPWSAATLPETTLNGPHTVLTDAAMKNVARAFVHMIRA